MGSTEFDIVERLDRIERMLAIVIGSTPPLPSSTTTEAKPRLGTLKARIACALEERDRKRTRREARA